MSLKRRLLNIFVAVVMVFGSLPITFFNAYAAGEDGIVPEAENIPKSLKSVKSNNDGTYDITLEIEGVSSQKNDATKANVIVVFDSSGSMGDRATTYTYSENTSGRYRKDGTEYIQLYRRNGWGNCSRMESDNSSTQVYTTYNDCVNQANRYTGTRYTRATVTGTRLSVAKSAVNVLANELLSQNDPETEGFEDVVEMAFIDFATTVKTNTTHANPTTDLNTFRGWVNATDDDGGTNWEAALNAAETAKDDSFNDDDKTYIIFVSDGNPTFRESQYGAGNSDCYEWTGTGANRRCVVWGDGNNDPSPYRNFNATKDVVDSILTDDNVEFYAIGTFGSASNMQNLGGTYYNATNQDALEAAFAEIVDKITMGLSVADLQIEDGITPATSTEVDGTAGNFRYSVPESWGDDWTKATYEGGAVHWNPGDHKTLSNGEKASVTFTVWPSQEAMDCIASLRNDGTCDENNLTRFGLGVHDDGSFYLITNSTATFRFKTATKNEDTGETEYSEISVPIDFDEKRDDTDLPETTLNVVKSWLDSMDANQRNDIAGVSVDLFVDREGESDPERHYTFSKENESGNDWVGEDQNSKSDYTVAPGVMKKLTADTEELRSLGPVVTVGSDEYVILEPGHDYEFDNENVTLKENGTDHYHITKYKYHPMIIGEGGNIHNVVFSEDGKTAVIEDGVLSKLSLENTLNGGILVGKTVINNDEVDTTIEDEYEVTITLSEETGIYRIYTYNPDGSEKERTEKKTYTGGVITEKITTNQKIRVQDVPTGTTYTVTEVLPNGYTRNKVDYTVVMYDGSEDKEGVQEVFGNASAQAMITNYLESGDLIIKKTVTATSGNLSEAQKKLFGFTVNFYEKEGDTAPVRVDDSTCNKKGDTDNRISHNGTCKIENIPTGWYYEIVEDIVPGFNNGQQKTETGTIKKGDNEETFTNNYAVTPLDPDEAKITVNKAFASGYEPFWIASDSFVFVMTGNGESVESRPLTLDGKTAEFKPVIADAGTYTYTITEKTTGTDGSSLFREGVSRLANDEDIVVTIVVEDKGDGTLGVVSKTYSKASQTIYNIYEGDNTYGGKGGELEFTKDLTGREWYDTDEFDFTISSATTGAPMPAVTTITADKDHKTVGFGKIKFTNKDVGNTYTYTITESFDVPSVEATGTSAGGISLTIEVKYNTTTGKIDLVVSDYEDTFTNEYKTTSVTAEKVWDDDEDRDGLRENYEGFFVAVKNDEGKYVAYEALALTDKDDYSFTNLPEKNTDGEMISYTIVEASSCSGSGESIRCTEFESDDDYTTTVDGNVITNFHEPKLYNEAGDLTVKKLWAGEGNELARPGSVTVELLANGEVIDTADIVAGQNNEWTYTFTDLYLNDGGEPIQYSVQESAIGETEFAENSSIIIVYAADGQAIDGKWEKSVSGYEVTNTWTKSTETIKYDGATKFYIKKVDEDYEPMEGVTFAIEGASDRRTDVKGMTSKSVPVSANEKEESFEFVVSEKETLEGYDLVEGSATVAVSCTSVFKSADPDTLVNTYTKTCEFEKSGSDKYVWDAEELTLTVVNMRSLARSLTIKKTVEGLSAEVLSDLEFTISGPRDFGEDGTMTLTVSKDCMTADDVITCRVSGRVPTGKYTVTESNAEVENFTLTVTGDDGAEKEIAKDEQAVFEITNTYEVDKITYGVVKIWDDTHDKDGKRPDVLTVELSANGEVIETVELTMKDAVIVDESDERYATGDIWVYVWEELPYADEYAEVISYTAEEILESDDYEMTETESDEYYTLFVNTHELDDPCAEGGCGGDIVPPVTPETGVFTTSRGHGSSVSAVNVLVGPAVVCVLSIMPILAFVISKKKNK